MIPDIFHIFLWIIVLNFLSCLHNNPMMSEVITLEPKSILELGDHLSIFYGSNITQEQTLLKFAIFNRAPYPLT